MLTLYNKAVIGRRWCERKWDYIVLHVSVGVSLWVPLNLWRRQHLKARELQASGN